MTAMVGVFGLAILGMVKVQKQFFPLSERPELFFELRLPEGTSIAVTAATTAKAEKLLVGDDGIATYTSHIGQGSPRFWLGLLPALPNSAFAQIVIVAKDVKTREVTKARLEKAIADGALAEARVRIDRFNFGPPVGFPVQFKVIGPDSDKVREIAREVRAVMRQNPHVVDPHLDWNEKAPAIQLVVAQDRARAMGLTPQDLAESLQTLVSGVTVTSIRAGSETIDIVARAAAAERLDLARLGDLSITTRGGAVVTVSQIADVKEISEEPILWRRNRDMEISVRADVVDGVQAPDVTAAIWPRLESIRAKLPPGYRLEIGGSVEESAKANASIFVLFPLMIGLMMLLLMMQLQSFTKLFLVVMSAPLGLIGASLALNLADKPFGFIALLGLIALSGMDMRNSVILVDQVQHDIDRGLTYREAIIESIVRRARPVVLTALAAILAMIPLSRSAFWGPMAFTVMGGLFVATLLTLMFLPALYAIWFRRRLDSPNPIAVPAATADPTMPASLPAMPAAALPEPSPLPAMPAAALPELSPLPVVAQASAARRAANDEGGLPLLPPVPRPLAAE
jgi:multidrug efflux pump subunit AcrB